MWLYLGAGLHSHQAQAPLAGLEQDCSVITAMALVCVEDFEQEARFKLDRNAWNYYSSGANLEQTLRDNVDAYKR